MAPEDSLLRWTWSSAACTTFNQHLLWYRAAQLDGKSHIDIKQPEEAMAHINGGTAQTRYGITRIPIWIADFRGWSWLCGGHDSLVLRCFAMISDLVATNDDLRKKDQDQADTTQK